MRKIILILFFSIINLANLYCEDKRPVFGIGLCVGEPTGVSFKLWLTKENAFGSVVAWRGSDKTYFHCDYLTHNYKAIRKGELTGEIPRYWGIGIKILSENDTSKRKTSYGLRIPLGINYIFAEMPIDFYGELVPTIMFYPDTIGMIDASLGVRYYLE